MRCWKTRKPPALLFLFPKSGYVDAMAEIFGNGGDQVQVSGEYECSECGHREHLSQGGVFPPDHHAQRPWTLYLKDEG